jgi:hypothetical protein
MEWAVQVCVRIGDGLKCEPRPAKRLCQEDLTRSKLGTSINMTGWWFQSFCIFQNIWDNPSHWLSYFSRWLKHVKTTNQMMYQLVGGVSNLYRNFKSNYFSDVLATNLFQMSSLGGSWVAFGAMRSMVQFSVQDMLQYSNHQKDRKEKTH